MRNLPDFSISGVRTRQKLKLGDIVLACGFPLGGHGHREAAAAILPQYFVSYTIEHKNLPEKRRFF